MWWPRPAAALNTVPVAVITWLIGNTDHIAGLRHEFAWNKPAMRMGVLIEVAKIANEAKSRSLQGRRHWCAENGHGGTVQRQRPSAHPTVYDPVSLWRQSRCTEHHRSCRIGIRDARVRLGHR